ncbi:MAG: carcinine hydrolase/isopenicillin-N N-acyltransferase family protein [Pseudomonadota bacterium]
MPVAKIAERAAPGGSGRLETWKVSETGKLFHILLQRGPFPSLAFDQGALLAREIEGGVVREIIDTIRVDTDAGGTAADIAARALFFDFVEGIHTASPGELQDGIRQLELGFRQGAREAGFTPSFSTNDIRMACLAIEAGNLATGFIARAARALGDASELLRVIRRVKAALRRYAGANPDDLDHVPPATLIGLIGLHLGRLRVGQGCTGFAIAPSRAAEGLGLHGRSFDGAFFTWNRHPVVHLMDERGPHDPRIRFRYAALGTAGLIYPGGISGVNEAGIACSLHQMSTTTFSTGAAGENRTIAPFLQQRILREAGTLGDAVKIAKETKHFASWTILVSDAANGRSLRIELNGRAEDEGGARVEETGNDPVLAQSNHFIHAALAERLDDLGAGSAHCTKTPGKFLETRARKIRVEAVLAGPPLHLKTAAALLADHEDAHLAEVPATIGGDATRGFGRTVVKAYGLMASIARAAPGKPTELWFTTGERLPGNHSQWAGVEFDFAAQKVRPALDGLSFAADTLASGRLRALEAYVGAFEAYTRPRDAAGRYLGRDPTPAELRRLTDAAIGTLGEAIAASETEIPLDVALRYVRFRLQQGRVAKDGENQAVLPAEALEDAAPLIEAAGKVTAPLTDWERALVLLTAAAAAKEAGDAGLPGLRAEAGQRLARAKASMPDGGSAHPGFRPWEAMLEELGQPRRRIELPVLDWVTVE